MTILYQKRTKPPLSDTTNTSVQCASNNLKIIPATFSYKALNFGSSLRHEYQHNITHFLRRSKYFSLSFVVGKMTNREQKVLHWVNKMNAILSIISHFLLYSYRRTSQLQLIQYIFEIPVIISFGLLTTFYYFRLLVGRTTNQTPENDRIGSFVT